LSIAMLKSPRFLFTSESVSEGHPDKICDQVSDAVLDALLEQDPQSRVACETAANTGLIMVLGEITTEAFVDISQIARNTIEKIGYTRAKYGFDSETCGVVVSVKEQSPDIAQGVNSTNPDDTGAGDQGMMFGYACRETDSLMPLPITLAHSLVKRLSDVRRTDPEMSYLRPDGKSQVSIEYAYGLPQRVDTIVIATQHDDRVDTEQLRKELTEKVVEHTVPADLIDSDTRILINATGRFVVGGPMGDAGLTGRKIIVDTYGGMARHGGGAFSGKDPTKVDRSGSYMSRYVAKNLVAGGIADRAEVQLAYCIGVAEPVAVNVETFGTERIDHDKIDDLIRQNFDLRPGAIIKTLNLRRPIYTPVAAYGHFGRSDLDLPWEKTDQAETLASQAGLEISNLDLPSPRA